MRTILAAFLALCCLQMMGQGSRIIIYPEGAYVPNAWINSAVDSVGAWRLGNGLRQNAVRKVASLVKENEQQAVIIDSLRSAMRIGTAIKVGALDLVDDVTSQRDKAIGKAKRRGMFSKIALPAGIAIGLFVPPLLRSVMLR